MTDTETKIQQFMVNNPNMVHSLRSLLSEAADALAAVKISNGLEQDVEKVRSAFNAAIAFTLSDDCDFPKAFLKYWDEGDWKAIAKEFPSFDLKTTHDPLAEQAERDALFDVIRRAEAAKLDTADVGFLIRVAKRVYRRYGL